MKMKPRECVWFFPPNIIKDFNFITFNFFISFFFFFWQIFKLSKHFNAEWYFTLLGLHLEKEKKKQNKPGPISLNSHKILEWPFSAFDH